MFGELLIDWLGWEKCIESEYVWRRKICLLESEMRILGELPLCKSFCCAAVLFVATLKLTTEVVNGED